MAAEPLDRYREKRDFSATPEPEPAPDEALAPAVEAERKPRFVVQEHHARRLHWDFRLERDGVLVSWAVPKGLPPDPSVNHLAVHTEDHPLSYIDFEGEIPKGNYGAGVVKLWDRGTYGYIKWEPSEVMVDLHGEQVQGRYVLFQTKDDQWMIHRMDPVLGGHDEPGSAAGEAAARRLAEDVPVAYIAYDLLYLDGHLALHHPYPERRRLLEGLDLNGFRWQMPAYHVGDGGALLALAGQRGLPGVVAKRLDGTYQPGRRSPDWIEVRDT